VNTPFFMNAFCEIGTNLLSFGASLFAMIFVMIFKILLIRFDVVKIDLGCCICCNDNIRMLQVYASSVSGVSSRCCTTGNSNRSGMLQGNDNIRNFYVRVYFSLHFLKTDRIFGIFL
jgi:hypothetical protein